MDTTIPDRNPRMIQRRPLAPLVIICDVLDRLQDLEISECNGVFQRMVVDRIWDTGKAVDDLTIGEVRRLIAEVREEWEQAAAR